jgi:hypothetical protein
MDRVPPDIGASIWGARNPVKAEQRFEGGEEGSTMARIFRVGLTRDFLKTDGTPAFGDVGLSLPATAGLPARASTCSRRSRPIRTIRSSGSTT